MAQTPQRAANCTKTSLTTFKSQKRSDASFDVPPMSVSPIPILMYHQVALPGPRGSALRGLCVSPSDFARHMRFLARLGYRGLCMTALLPYLQQKQPLQDQDERVFGLTFDDGFENNWHHALPVLEELGFSSTCFVVSHRLGKTNLWDDALGVAPARLMNLEQLRQWQARGQEIGAHTATHARLTELSITQAQREIKTSRRFLQDSLGTEIDHFAYPYGAFSAEHITLVKEAGFKSACTTKRGRYLPSLAWENRAWTLPRIPIARTTTRAHLWLKVATAYEDKK
jgi:peptidoglycan/xylan/chitin deacetylase (PgdA/CDA1 family)